MSIREQEGRQKEAEKRIDRAMRQADRNVRGSVEARAREADKRAREVIRRIEKGDVEPRPLPGLREDSMESMESMQSMQSMESMQSIESAETESGVTGEADPQGMQEGMPLEEAVPYNAAERGEGPGPAGYGRHWLRRGSARAQRAEGAGAGDGDDRGHRRRRRREPGRRAQGGRDGEQDVREVGNSVVSRNLSAQDLANGLRSTPASSPSGG